MRKIHSLLLVVTLPLLAQSSQVTIGLTEYDALRRQSETPSATVIDTVLLSGSFRERELAITFTGRATGSRPLARVLEQTNEVTIAGCKGSAILARGGKGAFDVIPLADTFELRCDLTMSGSDRLRLHVTQAVLAVHSTVEDGELVGGEEDDAGARDYTLVRHVSGPGETLAATATGRYLITLLPDATRFRYAIDVHNPNRTTSTLELTLRSNEHLQQIDSAAPYEVTEGRYVFSIPPGDSTITMTGELRGTSFIAPVTASLQYLVLESHPLLRPTVQTPTKRISLGETGVTPAYRGALAFETGTGRITWAVARLEALHAISYAVNHAEHTLFIPLDGPVLGESSFALRNEGAAELVLPAKPEPSYVSFDDQPMLMTKNAAGQLTVPLSPGSQSVLVQHRQPLTRTAGLAFGALAIPQLDVPATNTRVHLTYPGQWFPLYQSFASRARIWTPEAGQLFFFLLLAMWVERSLAWLGLTKKRIVVAVLIALAALLVKSFLFLVVVAFGALTILWVLTRPTLKEKLAYVAAAILAGFILMIAYVAPVARKGYDYESMPTSVMTDTMSADAMRQTGVPPPPKAAAPAYQGLPAKFTLPGGERGSTFSQELLRTDRPQTAKILAISILLTNWIGVLLALVAIVILWPERRALVDAIRSRIPRPQTDIPAV
jgi:hypothetical protein